MLVEYFTEQWRSSATSAPPCSRCASSRASTCAGSRAPAAWRERIQTMDSREDFFAVVDHVFEGGHAPALDALVE